MAINQFIAHHSVIFKPEQKIMWVSTSPWQSGRYVAYDLNKIFNDSIDFTKEIYTDELTIPEEQILHTLEYTYLKDFKSLTKRIKKYTKDKTVLVNDLDTLGYYIQTNPEYYHTYDVVGDYLDAMECDVLARDYWRKALTKAIPRPSEKERIEKKLK